MLSPSTHPTHIAPSGARHHSPPSPSPTTMAIPHGRPTADEAHPSSNRPHQAPFSTRAPLAPSSKLGRLAPQPFRRLSHIGRTPSTEGPHPLAAPPTPPVSSTSRFERRCQTGAARSGLMSLDEDALVEQSKRSSRPMASPRMEGLWGTGLTEAPHRGRAMDDVGTGKQRGRDGQSKITRYSAAMNGQTAKKLGLPDDMARSVRPSTAGERPSPATTPTFDHRLTQRRAHSVNPYFPE